MPFLRFSREVLMASYRSWAVISVVWACSGRSSLGNEVRNGWMLPSSGSCSCLHSSSTQSTDLSQSSAAVWQAS